MILKAWAIRHKPTGNFMPKYETSTGNGASFWEPTGGGLSPSKRPAIRLFKSHLAASRSLQQWLRGTHHAVKKWESDGEGYGGSYEVTVGTEVRHDPFRKKEDMEIVEFNLVEQTNG